jgi:hypothetical protein
MLPAHFFIHEEDPRVVKNFAYIETADPFFPIFFRMSARSASWRTSTSLLPLAWRSRFAGLAKYCQNENTRVGNMYY